MTIVPVRIFKLEDMQFHHPPQSHVIDKIASILWHFFVVLLVSFQNNSLHLTLNKAGTVKVVLLNLLTNLASLDGRSCINDIFTMSIYIQIMNDELKISSEYDGGK